MKSERFVIPGNASCWATIFVGKNKNFMVPFQNIPDLFNQN